MVKDKNNKEQEAGEIISRGEQFFEKHSNLIFYVILGIVIVAFGIWAYVQYIQKPRATKAYEALFHAEEQFIKGEDSTVLITGGITDQGVLEEIKKYSGTKASKLGHLYAGIVSFDLGNYQEALDHLNKYSAKDNMVAPSVIRLKGDCYVQLDKLDQAAKLFEEAAELANNDVISPGCLMKAARVYEHQQKYDKALQAYNTIKEKYYTATEAKSIEADIIRVQAQIGK